MMIDKQDLLEMVIYKEDEVLQFVKIKSNFTDKIYIGFPSQCDNVSLGESVYINGGNTVLESDGIIEECFNSTINDVLKQFNRFYFLEQNFEDDLEAFAMMTPQTESLDAFYEENAEREKSFDEQMKEIYETDVQSYEPIELPSDYAPIKWRISVESPIVEDKYAE